MISEHRSRLILQYKINMLLDTLHKNNTLSDEELTHVLRSADDLYTELYKDD